MAHPTANGPRFTPAIPADVEHAPLVREEAIDWLESQFPGVPTFTAGALLRMAGESGQHWLIHRIRGQRIGDKGLPFTLPNAANVLTILFLRGRGIRFQDAVDAVKRAALDQDLRCAPRGRLNFAAEAPKHHSAAYDRNEQAALQCHCLRCENPFARASLAQGFMVARPPP